MYKLLYFSFTLYIQSLLCYAVFGTSAPRQLTRYILHPDLTWIYLSFDYTQLYLHMQISSISIQIRRGLKLVLEVSPALLWFCVIYSYHVMSGGLNGSVITHQTYLMDRHLPYVTVSYKIHSKIITTFYLWLFFTKKFHYPPKLSIVQNRKHFLSNSMTWWLAILIIWQPICHHE